MNLLLDTHVFLWWRMNTPQLVESVQEAIMEESNRILISTAVVWEIVIKRALGRLDFQGRVTSAITEEGFEPLSASVRHADEVAVLPPLHHDPFDRLLIAQARCDGLTLVTHDEAIAQYRGFDIIRA